MPFVVTMPKLSPTMEEGVIAKWHKHVGDHVDAGELLIEVATDKATVEHEVIDGGWLREILIQEGESATVNQAIAVFSDSADESLEGFSYGDEQPAAAPSTQLEKGAQTSEGRVEEKRERKAPPQQTASEVKVSQPSDSKNAAIFTPEEPPHQKRIVASPLAKKLAKERMLDLSTLKGTGPGGRIIKRDLEKAPPLQTAEKRIYRHEAGSYEEQALTPMRKAIGKRMQESKSLVPHFYIEQAVDASPMVAFRTQLRNFDIKLTYNDLVIKACALALKSHPEVNRSFDAERNLLRCFKTVDIAVAVSTPGGLVTPIVTHADSKSLTEISFEVKNLAKRAKEGKLTPQEYQGGSFTISNLGMYGVNNFLAIINPPQAAILAVSAIIEQPTIKHGVVVAGEVLNLTLSVDHRVIDGVEAAQFIMTVKKYLENPAILIDL